MPNGFIIGLAIGATTPALQGHDNNESQLATKFSPTVSPGGSTAFPVCRDALASGCRTSCVAIRMRGRPYQVALVDDALDRPRLRTHGLVING
jgi:hypothetical protein